MAVTEMDYLSGGGVQTWEDTETQHSASGVIHKTTPFEPKLIYVAVGYEDTGAYTPSYHLWRKNDFEHGDNGAFSCTIWNGSSTGTTPSQISNVTSNGFDFNYNSGAWGYSDIYFYAEG